jgi:hypothetical protein
VLTLVFVFLESYLILYPNVRTWPKIAPRFDAMGVGFVPTADTCNMKVSGEVRPILLKNSIFFEVAGIRLEWPAGFSRISDAPGM